MHPTILYVEDDEDDVFFMRRTWTDVGVPNPLQVVNDASAARRYLSGTGPYANRVEYPIPGLILLDLKLPGLLGTDLLKWIREQPTIHSVRVIMLSSSNRPADIQAANELGANSYIVKPAHVAEWRGLVEHLQTSWLT